MFNKEVIIEFGKKAVQVGSRSADLLVDTAVTFGGLIVTLGAFQRRFGFFALKKAANLAHAKGLKEGDILDVYMIESGIPFIIRKTADCVSMYKVVKIKDDGKYVMRYVGKRGFTREEVELLIEEDYL